MRSIRVFRYLPTLDAFLPTIEYRRIADYLGLSEWNPVVWIGRLFTQDNDFGEHWFDNWEEREARETQAAAMGIDTYELLVVVPERMADGRDGPCHTADFRKRFWTSVLSSLELELDLLIEEARANNERAMKYSPETDYIENLEGRITEIRSEFP